MMEQAWKVEPVGEKFPGLAYVVEPNGRQHGAMNHLVAAGLVRAINAGAGLNPANKTDGI